MNILLHRINSISEINPNLGLEIDVRDYENILVLSHDSPSGSEQLLDDFLKHIDKNQLLAINVKSSEIENQLKLNLDKNNIKNYFTFDWSVPSLIKALNIKLSCAFRLSEYEQFIFDNCSWAWIDAFHSIWYDEKLLTLLHDKNIKTALVSPELHDRNNELKKIKEFVNLGLVDAVCTDIPEYYQK